MTRAWVEGVDVELDAVEARRLKGVVDDEPGCLRT
jgi:hypothetical protein